MIKVWSDLILSGRLDRLNDRGTTFSYDPGADPLQAVSVTMPVRLQSWDARQGLLPIFEMNLPEGYLRDRISRQFAKSLGKFDDFDLLSVIGRTQMGRLRYSGIHEKPDEDVPFQAIDDILKSRRDGELFDYLLEKFTSYSGISGVQPKVLVRDNMSDAGTRMSPSFRGATHIVKLWDPREYPELAANEFFCLMAAARAGLDVPRHRLSEGGEALVIDRFDLKEDGHYIGMEDFCVLNGRNTNRKYDGSYESAVMKRAAAFLGPEEWSRQGPDLYKLIVLNCIVRNGDAHLKNFALLYDDVNGRLRLAPVYDVVTTTAYLPKDQMALVMNGSSKWPDRQRLVDLGTRAGLSAQKAGDIINQVAQAVASTRADLAEHVNQSPAFKDIAPQITAAWETGLQDSALSDGRFHTMPETAQPLSVDVTHDPALKKRVLRELTALPSSRLAEIEQATRGRLKALEEMPKPSRLELQEKRGLVAGLKLIAQASQASMQSPDKPVSTIKQRNAVKGGYRR